MTRGDRQSGVSAMLGIAIIALLLVAGGVASMFARPRKEVPVYHSLPAFTLSDERGETFDLARMQGTVWVADFIFLGCSDVCPRLTERMRLLQDEVAHHDGAVKLVSFSVDPYNDTPERMQAYGKSYGADPARWSFVTGEAPEMERTVVGGFKLAMGETGPPAADGKTEIIRVFHGEKLVLVDAAGRIRGYYDSDEAGRAALLEDVDAVVEER